MKKIENHYLIFEQYDEQTLKFNIELGKLSPYTVLTKQKNISNEFIFKYILNEKYCIIRKDYEITIHDVIRYHPNFKNYCVE